MNVVNNYPSVVTMDKIYFNKLEFAREKDILANELNVKFESSVAPLEGVQGKYRAILQCIIEDPQYHSLHICVSMIGIFECKSDNPELLETLVNENTFAIMFPFLRSQISLMTTQPDMSPVIIPPMNITSVISGSHQASRA